MFTSPAPLVSVITPTWNRETFLPRAYQSFAAQDVGSCEWIVIDDNARPSAFMTALDDPRVIYRHFPQRLTIGEKRNLAIGLASADVIAHFDDDDYYAPHYLRTMLAHLRASRADLVKLSAFFLYSRVYRQFAWWDLLRKSGLHFGWTPMPMSVMHFPDDQKVRGATHLGYGFSYVYTKQLWEAQRFGDVSYNEDGVFIEAAVARGAKIDLLADNVGLCVHVLHAENVSICCPQYLLPDSLVSPLFPHFAAAIGA